MRLFSTLIFIIGFLLGSFSAMAGDRNHGYVGLLGGVAFPDTSSSAFTLGFSSSYSIRGPLGVGLFYLKYGIGAQLSSGAGSALIDTSFSFYGADVHTFFGGSLSDFSLGIRLGLVHSTKKAQASTSGTTTVQIDDASTNLFIGPNIAYDHPIGRFSLGGEIAYFLSLGSDAPKAFTILAASKFWF